MRVLLAPQEIAGYMSKLKSGLLECGIETRFFDLTSSYAKYGGETHHSGLIVLRVGNRLLKDLNPLFRRFLLFPLEILIRFHLFSMAILWADVIIIGFASSYFWGFDLPIYKLLGKKIISIYFGSDSRPLYLNGKFIYGEGAMSISKIKRCTARQKKRVNWFDRYSDLIVDHPPTAQFHEKKFIPFLSIGIPTVAPDKIKIDKGSSSRTTIIHAPSSPICKGTSYIREIVSRAAYSHSIEYVEMIGKKNSEVIECLAKSDVVIDEIYSDSLLAGLGTEAAVQGVPTLVTGYSNINHYGVSVDFLPPVFTTLPEKLEELFHWMLNNPEEVKKKGLLAEKFVMEKWCSKEVAYRLINALIGNSCNYYDPLNVNYFMGWGVSEEVLKCFLSQYVRMYGIKALYLDDKPRLIKEIIEFIKE